jgi:hypothetical protein
MPLEGRQQSEREIVVFRPGRGKKLVAALAPVESDEALEALEDARRAGHSVSGASRGNRSGRTSVPGRRGALPRASRLAALRRYGGRIHEDRRLTNRIAANAVLADGPNW